MAVVMFFTTIGEASGSGQASAIAPLAQIADAVQATVLSHPEMLSETCVERVIAANRMSEILNHACERVVLVTDLANAHLLHVADLLDVPCLCLLNGMQPEPALVLAARRGGKVLLVSPFDMHETCRRLDRFGVIRPDGLA